MADKRITYKVVVDYTKGFSADKSHTHLEEGFEEFKKHVKERIVNDFPAKRGAQIAELVSITEEE